MGWEWRNRPRDRWGRFMADLDRLPTVRMNLKLDADIAWEIRKRAVEQGKEYSQLVNDILTEYFDQIQPR